MAHQSEDCVRLELSKKYIGYLSELGNINNADVPSTNLLVMPPGRDDNDAAVSENEYQKITNYCASLNPQSTICILTTPPDAARLLPFLEEHLKYQLWIAVKLQSDTCTQQDNTLKERHAALLVFTRYSGSLNHTKTRIGYTYCPACGKTTKDYGGKKHVYHEYGTLMSDVWRDIECNLGGDIASVEDRLSDVFGISPYKHLNVLDLRKCRELEHRSDLAISTKYFSSARTNLGVELNSQLMNSDCMEALRSLPDNCIDFCFADPPYNIKKKYDHWNDGLELLEYFRWCDEWLSELARVLKPGKTLAVINIPSYAARHYQHLASILNFQSWIVWEGLSLPVRMIMPAHYSIICFSKGTPDLMQEVLPMEQLQPYGDILFPMEEFYCLRGSCVSRRQRLAKYDRGELSDLWHDIHRLKHNSKRVDHPCQLPPSLMARLIALYTKPFEVVLDCFNGAGTTTLVAQQMKRKFVGIEMSPQYHKLASERHELLSIGGNPFAKNDEVPKAKNSRVERLPKQKYAVPKKQLQLDIRRIANQLGHVPSKEEVSLHSKYPMEYFNSYFVSWGEVCAAARTMGMSELPPDTKDLQPSLFDLLETIKVGI